MESIGRDVRSHIWGFLVDCSDLAAASLVCKKFFDELYPFLDRAFCQKASGSFAMSKFGEQILTVYFDTKKTGRFLHSYRSSFGW